MRRIVQLRPSTLEVKYRRLLQRTQVQRREARHYGITWLDEREGTEARHLSAPDSPFTGILSESEVPNVQPVGITGRHWEELDCLAPPDRRREEGVKIKSETRERERERMWEKRYREADVQREKNTVKYINSWGKEEGRWRGKRLHLPRTRSNINITHCRDSASSLILVLLSAEKTKPWPSWHGSYCSHIFMPRDTTETYTDRGVYIHRLYVEERNGSWLYTGLFILSCVTRERIKPQKREPVSILTSVRRRFAAL